MKTDFTLTRSMRARLKEIPKLCDTIANIADDFDESGFEAAKMAAMRDALNKLAQAVHEFNAYRNALETK